MPGRPHPHIISGSASSASSSPSRPELQSSNRSTNPLVSRRQRVRWHTRRARAQRMAQHVQQVRNVLFDFAGDYMALDSSCGPPPIDLVTALKKARASVEADVGNLPSAADTASVIRIARKNQRVCYSFLLLQVHARGSQTFWSQVDGRKLFAYLMFRVTDIFADVLTHLHQESFDCSAVLDDVCSRAAVDRMYAEACALERLIREQRQEHTLETDWVPSELDLAHLMQQHADNNMVGALKRYALIAAGVAAVATIAWVVLKRR
eukprot:m.41436 g.41436  ORF g.41436 m.41436 type:complete len:264 (+) comp11457_c2_seq1:433-1224(+)